MTEHASIPSRSTTPQRRFDIFNGDADGLCAALQWRLDKPGEATLITGTKRDIELVRRVPLADVDEVNIFDVSMLRNQAALEALLRRGVRVRWFDHHVAPAVPSNPLLEAHLDSDPAMCSSLIVDCQLAGRFRAWALVGAYGDNLTDTAEALARAAGCDGPQCALLRRLGEALNYNAYGDALAELLYDPAVLYEAMLAYPDPWQFVQRTSVLPAIEQRYFEDLRQARVVQAYWSGEHGRVTLLPDVPWAGRVIGSLANVLANEDPWRAQAVLKLNTDQVGYRVSVRAPRASPQGASALCAQFGGVGRAGAAGIDALPLADLPGFVAAFAQAW